MVGCPLLDNVSESICNTMEIVILVIEAAPHCVPFPSRFFALFAFTSSAPGPVDFYLIFCEKWPFLSLSNAWAFHSPFLSFFL